MENYSERSNFERLKKVDVAIVGGGIVGVTTAYYLTKRGFKVLLLEKGRIGGEQSSRNWGAVRQQGRDPAELPLMMECNRIWRTLETELNADLDWRQQGNMRVAYDNRTLSWAENWIPTAKEHGLDTQLLTSKQVAETLPHFRGTGCLGGMFTPSDGCAEPEKVSVAFARAAMNLGAEIVDFCAVNSIETQNGSVCGVVTERGRVQSNIVVCGAGAWTNSVLRTVNVKYPSLWVRGSVAQTEPIGIDLRKLLVWGKCAYRQRTDGSITLAAAEDGYHDIVLDSLRYGLSYIPLAWKNWKKLHFAVGKPLIQDLRGEFTTFTTHRTLDPPPDIRGLERAAREFANEYPSAQPIRFKRKWAGWVDYMPDELPIIDQLHSPRGLFVAAGLSGHGFGMGPIVGQILASLIKDGRTQFDLTPFRSTRFS